MKTDGTVTEILCDGIARLIDQCHCVHQSVYLLATIISKMRTKSLMCIARELMSVTMLNCNQFLVQNRMRTDYQITLHLLLQFWTYKYSLFLFQFQSMIIIINHANCGHTRIAITRFYLALNSTHNQKHIFTLHVYASYY